MLGFGPLSVAALGVLGLASPVVPALSITPISVNGNVNIPTLPFTISSNTPLTNSTIIEFNGDMGGLFMPPYILGSQLPASLRFIPASLGLNTIRFTNTGGIINPSNVTVSVSLTPAPPAVPQPTKTIRGTLRTEGGVPRPNLSGLQWSWFDQDSPSSLLFPMDQGSNASTDSHGELALVVKSNLTTGQFGSLVITDANAAIPGNRWLGFRVPVQ